MRMRHGLLHIYGLKLFELASDEEYRKKWFS